jgi:hypothetical protein
MRHPAPRKIAMQEQEGVFAKYEYMVFADYRQVYLEDCDHKVADSRNPEEQVRQIDDFVSAVVNRESLDRWVGATAGAVCIFTARNTTVPVTVEVRANQPEDDLGDWEHVVEASLEVPSGCIKIYGVTESSRDDRHIVVEPSTYRVRVYFGGLHTVSADGLKGDDHYRAVLWPAPYRKPAVLRADSTSDRRSGREEQANFGQPELRLK